MPPIAGGGGPVDSMATMRLPAAQLAIVEPAKIRDYLLSPEHPVGRYKASFFNALGGTRGRIGSGLKAPSSTWSHRRRPSRARRVALGTSTRCVVPFRRLRGGARRS